LNIILGLLLVLINLYVLTRSSDKGIKLYVILTMISPVTIVLGVSLSYDYLFLPFVLIWAFQRYGINLKRVPLTTLLLAFYYVWLLVITTVTAIFDATATVEGISLIGTFKYVFLYALLSNEVSVREEFNNILRTVIFVNCIVMLIEYILLMIYPDRDVISLCIRLFTTSGSEGSLKAMYKFGEMGRLYGTFPSSAFPATLSIVGLGIFINEYSISRSWKSIAGILGSVVIGFASSSKRFFLGAVLVVGLYFVLKPFFRTDKQASPLMRTYSKLPILIVAVSGAIYYLYTTLKDSLVIDYYLDYLINFRLLDSLSTRFGNNGVVNSMIPVIKNNLFTGVGEVSYSGIAVTDSFFFVTLYKSGIIGLFAFLVLFIVLFTNAMKARSMNAILVLAVVIFEFIISTEFFSPMGILFVAYVTNVVSHKEKKMVFCPR